MSALDLPVDAEKSIIGSNFNSFALLIFLMGMYTVIYFGTIYVYFRKNPCKYHPVPAAITMLFLCSVAQFALQWYETKQQFVDNGDTRQSVFDFPFEIPRRELLPTTILIYIIFVIADGLLIWRCYFVWNRSLRVILVPLFLIFAEIALFIVQVGLNIDENDVTSSPALVIASNDVLTAAFFLSFATTLAATILIAYRIYSVSKYEGASARRFKHVIDIVVQSGAVYALSQFTAAIVGIVPGNVTIHPTLIALEDYTQNLDISIAAISATVMVARVALLADDTTYPSTSIHLSGLQFHARSTHPATDVETTEVTHSFQGNHASVGKERVVEGKAQ